jgi:hypothetical protein
MKLLILILSLFISCTACNSNSQKTDNDIVPDTDAVPDTETVDESNDTKSEAPDEILDENPDVECLDLRYNENTIKTPFPFKDEDGRSTFCRPGCDTPTENDPQCVRNIWEWDNWEKYQKYLEAQKADPAQRTERECYPWPCKLPDMEGRGINYVSPCDRAVSGYGYGASTGTVWTHGMSDGVAGLLMSRSAIEYDPEKDEFVKVGQAAARLVYNRNRYVVVVYDRGHTEDNIRSFIVSIERRDGEYYYELIYDNKDHNAFFSRPPFVGKDWALIQVCEGSKGHCDVKYAKSDKWEWHSLNIGKVQEGNIVDDRLSFIIHDGTNDRQIFYCDMSKHPKSFHECTRVTRKLGTGGYELGHSPRIDEDDKNRLIYYIYDSDPQTFVEVKFEDGKEPEYTEYSAEHLVQPDKVKGDIMIYASSLGYSFINCWYRFDKNKSYCPTKSWSTTGAAEMLYGTFSGKWQLWKTGNRFIIRDWECYCDETGLCPLEE